VMKDRSVATEFALTRRKAPFRPNLSTACSNLESTVFMSQPQQRASVLNIQQPLKLPSTQ
jgi:hypothetical protein